MDFGPRALIDLSAVRHNLERVRQAAPASRVMAVIKANGYGHGLVRIAAALGGADALAVARVPEAIVLRRAGFAGTLVVLEGCFESGELRAAAEHHLTLVIHSEEQLRLLGAERLARPVACWLKVDTGMHRIGFRWDRAANAYRTLCELPSVKASPGLMSHLASADDLADDLTREQTRRLHAVAGEAGAEALSIANSAGILCWPETRRDWVRPGLMIYGISPMLGGRGSDWDLRPAMTLMSRLIAVTRLKAGDRIGYGGIWTCPEDMPVGVVAIGYGDGYPRHAGSGTPVLVGRRRAPIVGRVSMDMISVDLRGCPGAGVGDPVVLWGEGLPVEEIAEHAGTISYELVCGVTSRVDILESDAATVLQEARA